MYAYPMHTAPGRSYFVNPSLRTWAHTPAPGLDINSYKVALSDVNCPPKGQDIFTKCWPTPKECLDALSNALPIAHYPFGTLQCVAGRCPGPDKAHYSLQCTPAFDAQWQAASKAANFR